MILQQVLGFQTFASHPLWLVNLPLPNLPPRNMGFIAGIGFPKPWS